MQAQQPKNTKSNILNYKFYVLYAALAIAILALPNYAFNGDDAYMWADVFNSAPIWPHYSFRVEDGRFFMSSCTNVC